jgi:hypothetical protein
MIVEYLVKFKSGSAKFVNLIRVLDIIAYLVVENSSRVDQPCKTSVKNIQGFQGGKKIFTE